MAQIGWTFDEDNPVYLVEEKPVAPIRQGRKVQAYLWARTVLCRACTTLIPLAPNWRLSRDQKLAIRITPDARLKIVNYKVVASRDASPGTVAKAIATCPACGATTRKGFLAEEAQANRMGHVMYAEVSKYYYSIYRYRGRPIQGRDKLEFTVPGDVAFYSDRERWRAAHLIGNPALIQQMVEEDPLLQDCGLFGGVPSEYAVGVSLLPPGAAGNDTFITEEL